MLKFRNISLLRRIYVWILSLITRIAHDPENRAPPIDHSHEAARIRRINSELEFGPSVWQNSFLHSDVHVAPDGNPRGFQLSNISPFLMEGIDAIVGDTLTRCFVADPPYPWNFLTRNIPPGRWQISPYHTLLWLIGIWARYCIFLPFRSFMVIFGIITFTLGWIFVYIIPGQHRKRWTRQFLLRYLASVVVASWSGYIKFHGQRPRRRPNQIYVANHTSLIDLFILNKDYNFSCIGQRHGGLAGFLQDLLMAAQNHVWFDREEGNDRRVVQTLLREHVADGTKEPMLVFPEGTCTNAEYCVMFKKGSFELDGSVYPIAMKYHRRFGDPFWNSQTTSFPRHLFDLMTSWAVVCDVYYMEPQTLQPGETAVQFANRVKRLICEQAGLISVNWDGFLKRHQISPKFLHSRQELLASVISRRLNGNLPRSSSSSILSSIDGGHPQLNSLANSSDMDTIGFDSLRQRTVDTQNLSRASLHREVLRLGRRNRGQYREPPRYENRFIRFFVYFTKNAIRWGLGIGLLVIMAVVTSRLMPQSWKEVIRPSST